MKEMPSKVTLSAFLGRFPEVQLPITLGEESHHAFSSGNLPLPAAMIEQFLLPLEEQEADDLTEFVACFRLEPLPAYSTVVYWRAGLFSYQYIMMTFNKKGENIDRRVIAGSYYDEQQITRSVATIAEDRKIFVVSGQSSAGGEAYDAAASTTYKLELTDEGRILNG